MHINRVIDRLNSFKLWGLLFLYEFFVSAFVQIILLPYVFPGLHAGKGLLNCSFDSIGFHELAVDLTNKIRIHGWSAWQLSPEGQSPAGIAAIFYFLILPDPRVLIPISAAFHASAALVLVNLLNLFVKNKTKAILCVLPFLIFPSNLQWTAQWHIKDGLNILGILLLLQSIISLLRLGNYNDEGSFFANFHDEGLFFVNFRSIIFGVFGIILIGLGRPYLLAVIKLPIWLFFALLFCVFLIRVFKKKVSWQRMLSLSVLILLFFLMFRQAEKNMYPVSFKQITTASADKPKPVQINQQSKAKLVSLKHQQKAGKDDSVSLNGKCEAGKDDSVSLNRKRAVNNDDSGRLNGKGEVSKDEIEKYWKSSSWLPPFVENKAYYLALLRRGFRLTEGGSNIDQDKGFGSIKDILFYIPRAAQIAFLAPFPNQRFSKGTYAVSFLMRRVASTEMIVVYFALLFLPYAIWHWRKRIEMWIISVFCTYMLITYGLIVCNIGSLYRLRYVYIMILVALGIAGFITFLDNLQLKKNK